MSAPDSILQLVDNFETHRRVYLSQDYNEAQVRLEFIDPFFEALGWDMFNKQSYASAYKDVIHEDALHMGGASTAPDYAFRIGGTRKFFVEAKKPAVNLKDAISPAYQLRRYAWSAKLPLSILTDFEEFTVYDCRLKPTLADKPSTGRIQLLTYRDYPTHWDEISTVFSRQAVLKGSFDQYAESATGKHGTAEVDDAFLAEIERWRDLLAHNIALRNPSLTQRDLNYAVQMTIDRLIFLRICEDRGIEFYGQLQALLNGGDVYPRLCQLFRNADDRYNSGLFHFRAEKAQADSPDALSMGLALDDKPLKDILGNLYYPESPYEFSMLPADILGQVYEQFLGKVIRLTSAHHAVVEDKPEVKKAGGVYYTPTFIVDYIVKHTLGTLLENRQPGEVGLGRGTPIRVLDMACGSGSFLLGAYQYLLDWYLMNYSTSEPEKWARGRTPQLVQVSHGDWRLTTAERKRILLDHIYGVDIDPQAVEVTKLSLLLKVLEGESQDTVGKQLSMFHQRALPDLGQNIKCGNSLIGPDFYSAQQSTFLDPEEQYRINAFDWQREFPQVFAHPPRSLWLVTFVTHNSRISERMVTYGVKSGDPLILDAYDRLLMARNISDTCRRHAIPVVAWDILPDHVHMVLAAEDEQELDEQVRKIKGASSYYFQRGRGMDEGGHTWAQKYHHLLITDQRMLDSVYAYVMDNHIKHAEQWGQDLIDSFEDHTNLEPTPEPPLEPTPTRGLSPLLSPQESPSLSHQESPLLSHQESPLLSHQESPLLSHQESPSLGLRMKDVRDALCVSPEQACQSSSGGFDIIIGNPPYIRQEGLRDDKEYFGKHYEAFCSTADIYVNFIEKGLQLLKPDGRFGMIVSNKWLRAAYGERLRELLAKKASLEQIVDLAGLPVFIKATVRTVIIICKPPSYQNIDHFKYLAPLSLEEFRTVRTGKALEDFFIKDHVLMQLPKSGREGWTLSSSNAALFIEHLNSNFTTLKEYIHRKPLRGIITGMNEAFVVDKSIRDELIARDPKNAEIIKPMVVGRDVRRYTLEYKDRYLIWTFIGVSIKEYPSIFQHLKAFEPQLQKRWDKGNHWWELRACDYYDKFVQPKIIYPDIATDCRFVLDTQGYFSTNTTYFIPGNDLYLLGILNSRLAFFYFSTVCAGLEGGGKTYLRFFGQYLEGFPVATSPVGSIEYLNLSSLIERMLSLHQQLAAALTPTDKTLLQRQIESIDDQIDSLVYELYGLTDEEISLVEGK